jgi:hypothetical protein
MSKDRVSRARRHPRPVWFSDLVPPLEQIYNHAWRLYVLAGDTKRLNLDSIPDCDAVETARRLVTQNIAVNVKGLLYHLDVLNSKFKPGVPPLTETEEQWLRRQLEGLTTTGGAA